MIFASQSSRNDNFWQEIREFLRSFMLRHHDRNLASLSQNIPNNLGNPGFFTKYPTAAESPLCLSDLSGYPRLPLREAVSPSNRHCQEPAVVGRHFPINSVISNIIYINICTLVAARTQYQWKVKVYRDLLLSMS